MEDTKLPRKASGRKAAKSARKTDKTQPETTAKVDPSSPEGQKIAQHQQEIEDLQRQHAAKAKPNYGASTHTLGGVTKILREEGDENTGKPDTQHVVQQGGGGHAVSGDSGQPLR